MWFIGNGNDACSPIGDPSILWPQALPGRVRDIPGLSQGCVWHMLRASRWRCGYHSATDSWMLVMGGIIQNRWRLEFESFIHLLFSNTSRFSIISFGPMCWPLARHTLFAIFFECFCIWRCGLSWVWAHGRVQSAANVGGFHLMSITYLRFFDGQTRPDPLCQRDSSCHRRWRQCRREMHRWNIQISAFGLVK